jgi:hypothetical protein
MQQPPFNPYAAPMASDAYAGAPGTMAEFFRSGDALVVRKGSVLPDVCVQTGVATGGNAVTKTLTWVPPWVAILFVLISPIIGAVVMLIVRKSGSLTYFLSREAQARRKRGVMIGLALVFGGIGLLVVGIAFEQVALVLSGFLAFIAGIIVAAVVGAPFRVNKIDADYIYLKVKPEFWSGVGPQQTSPPIYGGVR